ncbi:MULTISPECIES: WXG100 family type VII secretion target [unclassified Streptomyces]|uniref:WXG100 family type VII secretion target n=1 Tax=unclassified Streptomyces TaxID=2593676 RepID=UPI0037F4F14E
MAQDDGTMIVTYAKLEEAAQAINQQAGRLDASLRAIKAKIASVSDLWEGEAREAYNRSQAEWDKDAMAIHTALKQISAAVDDAGRNYRSGDKRAAANF